jgi:hypothetical protein
MSLQSRRRTYWISGILRRQHAAPTLTTFLYFHPEYNISYAKVKVNLDGNEPKIQVRNSGSSRGSC